ncbi:methyl-accepting chemotaxis protein [Bacillus sp. J33]|uniref:methyl-accepting chemotaxis protein n=1 Tax=Bacillus sp. J33 TaxID=935836 RepID=UPI00047DD3AF|nr:HAMP domain-containing methyl-accepting chemotaxis protein [Bacillus sp. J33]
MNIFKKVSFVTKSIITTATLILLVGVVLIILSLSIQNGVLTAEMEKQAIQIANSWGEKLDKELVEEASKASGFDAEADQELTAYFDNISATNPNVAQAYIMGTDLNEKNQSAVIATPTHIKKALQEDGKNIGDLYEHPETIAKSIKELNKTKEITTSQVYEDQFGTWVTVLYPIQDSAGKVSSFFGVDIDASMVSNGTDKFLFSSLLILIPAIIIIVLFQIFVIRRSFKPLIQLQNGINEMKNGNLDIKLPAREDELGKINEAFNEMVSELSSMIVKIRKTSETVLQSSELVSKATGQSKEHSVKISENIKQMTAGIQAQEISVTESAGAMEQIAAEISSIAHSSQDVSLVSKRMENYAIEGLEAISDVVSQMETINGAVKQSSNIIGSLKVRSDEITSILEVITGISNQTNLLALNAAIEAARAGEHGKGFAVVAQEVRKLAEESSQSTEEISKIIDEIQFETNNAVSSMDIGTKEAEKGTKVAQTTGELFYKIKEITDQISNQIEGVSAATQEISAGTEEVTASVNDLAAIAQSNSNFTQDIKESTVLQLDSINQLSEASKELNALANELQGMITKFKA